MGGSRPGCELTFELSPVRRAELVAAFGPFIPDAATEQPSWDLSATGLLVLATAIVLALVASPAAKEHR